MDVCGKNIQLLIDVFIKKLDEIVIDDITKIVAVYVGFFHLNLAVHLYHQQHVLNQYLKIEIIIN